MEKRSERLFSKKQIWMCVLVGMVMLALLLICSQAAPTSARAESPSDAAGSISESAVFVVNEETILPEEGQSPALSEAGEDEQSLDVEDGKWTAEQEALVAFICNIIKDIIHFDINNADPTLVSIAHYFSGYMGQFLFFGNWANRRSGSFGRLMGLYGNDKENSEILKHEHGHYVQYRQLGLVKYIVAIAIPSLMNNPRDYYSQPWEVTADLFGGVTTHYHSPGSEEAGIDYLNKVKNAGTVALITSLLLG